jgi:NitT/TauT family transport system ATP-binding protein
MLKVDGLSKVYGSGRTATPAIRQLSFVVPAGEVLCIVGPSGCGKSTLLRCLSGLHQPTSGTVVLEGKAVTGPPDGLAMVFQDYSRSLMPWLSVKGNVTLPLRAAGVSRRERAVRAMDSLRQVGIEAFADRRPWQLSGGMQQRVAIARALACRPRLLLMDEPFASVDAQTRSDLEDLLLRIQRDSGVTTLLVTHDIDEAVYLGHRVLVLTSRPTTLARDVICDLPTERDQMTTKALPEFLHLRAEVLSAVRSSPTGQAGDPGPANVGHQPILPFDDVDVTDRVLNHHPRQIKGTVPT